MSYLRERFAPRIEAGELILIEAAISTSEDEASFWLCDDATDGSR
jgi:hypothetical protein